MNLGIDAGAGTGKSTTLIYLAYLLREQFGDQQKVTITAFNRKAKLELDAKIKQVGLSAIASAKTYNGLGFSAFMKAKQVTDADRQMLDLSKLGGSKYKKLARYLIERHLPLDERTKEQIADASKTLARLFDLVRANTTYTHTGPRSLKLFMGGSIDDAGALVDYDLANADVIGKFLLRYGLFLDFPEDEQMIVQLIPELYRLGQLAIDDPKAARRMFRDERWGNWLDGERMWVDFTDQMHGTVVNQWRVWGSRYLFMDEAQDASPLDRALIDLHRYRQGQRVMAHVVLVGDPNQAIYGFRGADQQGFANSMHYLGIQHAQALSVTRRCSKAIVRTAQRYKPEYTAFERNAEGEVCDIHTDDLIRMVENGDALISRTRAPLFTWRNRLMRAGKACTIVGKDMSEPVIALLESVAEMDGFTWSKVGEFLERYRDERVARMRSRNRPEPDVEAFIDDVATVAEILDAVDAESLADATSKIERELNPDNQPEGGIALGTAHSMKGLEYERVFLITPDRLPMIWASQSDEEYQQELNLTYVAITRGKSGVYWVKPDAKSYFTDPVTPAAETDPAQLSLEFGDPDPVVDPRTDIEAASVIDGDDRETDGGYSFMIEHQTPGAVFGAPPFSAHDWLMQALRQHPAPLPSAPATSLLASTALNEPMLDLIRRLANWKMDGKGVIGIHMALTDFQREAQALVARVDGDGVGDEESQTSA